MRVAVAATEREHFQVSNQLFCYIAEFNCNEAKPNRCATRVKQLPANSCRAQEIRGIASLLLEAVFVRNVERSK